MPLVNEVEVLGRATQRFNQPGDEYGEMVKATVDGQGGS